MQVSLLLLGASASAAFFFGHPSAMTGTRRECLGVCPARVGTVHARTRPAAMNFFTDLMSQLTVQTDESDMPAASEVMPAEVKARGYAQGSHILLASPEAAEEVRGRIEAGELSFADAARQFSQCKSKGRAGNLGTFKSLARILYLPYEGKFSAVVPFDDVVFSSATAIDAVNIVTTEWGTHLVTVTARDVQL